MKRLVAAALVGTARQTSVPATGSAVDPLIAALATAGIERRLLLTAGAAAVHRQAGYSPMLQALPSPSEPEPLRAPSERSAALIATIITGPREALLPEVGALLARAGRHLPAALLPQILDTKAADVRAALLPVLGTRGRWLAGFNAGWRWVLEADVARKTTLPEDADTIWQEGAPSQRSAVLALARATEPERARAWLASTWKAERAEQRADFLDALAGNLSLDDEPFLEAALDDRSERVRSRAGALLSTLPESAFAARMIARAPSLLDYRAPGLLTHRSGLIVPVRPQEIDKKWQRDLGIAHLPAQVGEADRTTYLTQTLALIPLALWVRQFGRDPETLNAAAEGEADVIAGWSRAALTQRDASWAGPLWDWWCDREEQNAQQTARSEMLQELLAMLPSERAEQLLARQIVRRGDTLSMLPWAAVIASLRRPWGVELSTVCLAAIRRFVGSLKPTTHPYYTFWYQNLPAVAAAISPACFDDALQLPAVFDPSEALPQGGVTQAWQLKQWLDAFGAFAGTVRLRQRLHRELAI